MPNASLSHASLRILTVTAGALVGGLLTAVDAHAQLTSAIDLASRTGRPADGSWHSQLTVSPFARFDHPRVALDGRWTALAGTEREIRGLGSLEATWFSPTRSGLQFSLAGFADRSLLNESFAVTRGGAHARLSFRTGSSGAWLGRVVARDNQPTPVSPVPRASAGGWRQWGNALVTFSLSSFSSREGTVERRPQTPPGPPQTRGNGFEDTLQTPAPAPIGPDTITVDSSRTTRRSWNDAEVALHWSTGRLAFRGVLGTRFHAERQPNELWGQVEGTVALAPDIALIASGGVHPSSAAYGLPRAQFVQMGFRIAPSALLRPRLPTGVRPVAAAFEVRRADRGQRVLRIRVPNARSVEVSGDFTGWKPIALTRAEADRWEVTLPIAPGMHRLAIRVDGDSWTVPPGVTAVPDEFQGTVGTIIISD